MLVAEIRGLPRHPALMKQVNLVSRISAMRCKVGGWRLGFYKL